MSCRANCSTNGCVKVFLAVGCKTRSTLFGFQARNVLWLFRGGGGGRGGGVGGVEGDEEGVLSSLLRGQNIIALRSLFCRKTKLVGFLPNLSFKQITWIGAKKSKLTLKKMPKFKEMPFPCPLNNAELTRWTPTPVIDFCHFPINSLLIFNHLFGRFEFACLLFQSWMNKLA